ncbi:uncharacterized protein [Nicotiana tomentosiformis]|uniref:uncharacterized protein n=1 Tax=Nicotiana tomentosiformis TaxID=4098 RepID=UPI00388C3FF7
MRNVLIWHDPLRHYNRKTSLGCLMKIDLRKAYDMVSWEFLEEALIGFGFPDRFIQWIMVCVTTTMFTVKINREGHGYFAGKRGLRQGDPLSPLLFILVMEYLSRSLKIISRLPDFRFHPMCKELQLTHLTFADDLMIFVKHVSSRSRRRSQGHAVSKNRICTGHISYQGDIFILPQSMLKEVDKLCKEYLWEKTEGQKKVALVAWEKVCCPNKLGGLNVKGCKVWNMASIGKLLWQLVMNKESLWVRWVHGVYMKADHNIWTHSPPMDSSWYWRELNALKGNIQGWYSQDKYILPSGGSYSITNNYLAMINQQSRLEIADLVWTVVALSRHRFVMWLAIQGRLLTKDRPIGMQIPVENINCRLCEEEQLESKEHMFVDCGWIKAIRQEINQWIGQSVQEGDFKPILKRIKRKHWKQFKKEVIAAINGAVIYHTWRAQNFKKFQGKNVHRIEIVTQIKKEITE